MGSDFLEVLHAVDVSMGGLGVQVPHGFVGYDISDEVELVVKVPGHPAFVTHGFVRHKNGATGSMFGVEFTGLPSTGRQRLEAYVNGRLRGVEPAAAARVPRGSRSR